MAIIQVVVGVVELPVFIIVEVLVIHVPDLLQKIGLLRDDVSGEGVQRDIEITQFPLVLSQVIHIEQHRPFQVGVIKENAGVVRDQQVGDDVQVVDVLDDGRVLDEIAVLREIKGIGNEIMCPEQKDVLVPQALLPASEIRMQVVGVSQPLLMLIVTPGWRVEDQFAVVFLGDAQEASGLLHVFLVWVE